MDKKLGRYRVGDDGVAYLGFIAAACLALLIVGIGSTLFGAANTPSNFTPGVTDFIAGPTAINSAGLQEIGTHYFVRQGQDIGASIAIEVGVTAGDLENFSVELCDQIQSTESGPTCNWYTYLSATDWDTATANLTFVSATGPQEVTTGGFAHAHIRVPARAIKFKATAATTATVTVRGVVTNR